MKSSRRSLLYCDVIAPSMAVRRWFQLRSTRLFFINIGTCCVLYTLGDLIQQRIEGKKRNDWRRTARMATMGLVCMGPMNHHFYVYLDKILPGASARIVAKKVAADMLVIAPIADCSFFTGKYPVDWSGELTCPDVITTGSP